MLKQSADPQPAQISTPRLGADVLCFHKNLTPTVFSIAGRHTSPQPSHWCVWCGFVANSPSSMCCSWQDSQNSRMRIGAAVVA